MQVKRDDVKQVRAWRWRLTGGLVITAAMVALVMNLGSVDGSSGETMGVINDGDGYRPPQLKKDSDIVTYKAWIMRKDKVKSWSDANDFCRSEYGTQLATVQDLTDVQALYDRAGRSLWTGLRLPVGAPHTEPNFVFESGVPRKKYLPWRAGEPNNSGSKGERCAHVNRFRELNDAKCEAEMVVVCDRFTVVDNWLIHKEMDPLTWSDANNYCKEAYGTQLATVQDSDSVDKLYNKVGGGFWTGLRLPVGAAHTEPNFVWESGVPRKKDLPWRAGEPNNSRNNGERCAHVNRFREFNDAKCDAQIPVVCDIPTV